MLRHTAILGLSAKPPARKINQHLPYNKADQIFKSTIIAPRYQGDGFAAGVQDRDNARANCDDEVDEEFPSIEGLWRQNSRHGILTEYQDSTDTLQHPEESALDTSGSRLSLENSRLDNSTGNSQGTRDKPVILEDDESDTLDTEAGAVSVLVDAHADPPFEPSKEPWYDIEDQCFVDEDLRPIPPLEQRGLASTPISMPAQDQPRSLHHSSGSSQDQINLHDDRITRIISEEPATYILPKSEDEDGEGWSDDNVAELEKEVQRTLQGKEKVPSTSTPTSLSPYPPSAEPPHPQIDQEDDQSGTSHGRLEELWRGSPRRSQDQEEPQEQQQRQEVAIELMREENYVSENEERELQGEKQQHQDGNEEISSDKHHPKDSDCSHTTSNEDDEGPRPAKRRKLPPSPTNNALTPPNGPISIDNDQYHPPRASRSPSARVESAEYQEWPFQGFLKRTMIGNETTYNLVFTLPRIPDHVHLPIPSEAFGNGSDGETPAEVATLHNAVANSKVRPAILQSRLKRVRWTPEEDATIVRMKEDGCSWEEIHATLPHRTQGTIQVHYSTKLKKEPR